ncbi:ABC transporter substrate-binding protein [Paenibacillus chartarius]|uniref:ABC transporter substrate-binding protein n=1 Tax=Paenibacillus chartarius TaxID=747481 RepID=A0ABV6DI27_9BACL
MKVKKFTVIATVVTLAAALAGCGSNPGSGASPAAGADSTGAKVAEVKIGSIHPISGSSAVEGQQMQDAIQMAVDEVNAGGGIKSLGGAKVTLVTGDNEMKAEKGVSEVQRMVREGVVGILGTYSSGVTLTATQEAEKQKVPFVVTISSVDSITERGFKYTFRLQPPASMMAQDFISQFKDLNAKAGGNLKTAVISHEDSIFGSSIADYIQKHASEAGLEILAKMPHPSSAADLTADVNKMKSLNPDVVIPITYLGDGKLLFQSMKNAGFAPKVTIGVANGAISNSKFITEDTGLNQYLLDVNYSINPKSEKAKTVTAAYAAKYNKGMGPNAAYSYEATKVLIDAIERAGSTDKTKIRDALSTTDYKDHILPQDSIVFDEKGQNKNARSVMNQIVDGKSVVVFPAEYKQVEVTLK